MIYQYKVFIVFIIAVLFFIIYSITQHPIKKSGFKADKLISKNKSTTEKVQIKLVQKFPEAIIIGQAKCGLDIK
jgi:hypothetical protein